MKRHTKELRDELAELAPLLHQLKSRSTSLDPVPSGYFERLPQEVMRRIGKERELGKAARSVIWRRRWFAKVTVAAAISGVVVLFFWWPFRQSARLLATVDRDVLEAYVADHIDEFEEDLILEVVPRENEDALLLLDEELLEQISDELFEDVPLEELEQML